MAYSQLINQSVQLNLAGSSYLIGSIIDIGKDMLVVHTNNRYVYIPTTYIHSLKKIPPHYITENSSLIDQSIFNSTFSLPPVFIQKDDSSSTLSFQKVIENAMSHYVEIKISPKETLTGKILSVQSDYCLFWNLQSQKHLIISLAHIKWLSPLHELAISEGIKVDTYNNQNTTTLPASLFDYLLSINNKHVEIDKSLAGYVSNVTKDFLELKNIYGEDTFIPLTHIKYIY